jgi:hypothetical protein
MELWREREDRIEISKDKLQLLVDSDAISTTEFRLIGVNQISDIYENNEAWKSQKAKSDKEYKKLKEIEFKLIHKIE